MHEAHFSFTVLNMNIKKNNAMNNNTNWLQFTVVTLLSLARTRLSDGYTIIGVDEIKTNYYILNCYLLLGSRFLGKFRNLKLIDFCFLWIVVPLLAWPKAKSVDILPISAQIQYQPDKIILLAASFFHRCGISSFLEVILYSAYGHSSISLQNPKFS